jgi:cell division protein ZapA
MAKVSVTLNGREFTIGCEEGQEEYLRQLAHALDARVRAISEQVGQIGDLRLLLMASLILVDEHKEQDERIAELEEQVERLGHERHGAASLHAAQRNEVASRLVAVAERLEAFATSLEDHPPEDDGTPGTDSGSRFAAAGA